MKPSALFSSFGSLLAGALLALPAGAAPAETNAATDSLPDIHVVLHLSKGDVKATLFTSKAPLTVANFLNLAEHKFYNHLTFHRVIEDFMIQGGDPDGSGSGGPGYSFQDEITDLKFDKPGILAMANSGQNTNGSQFFITHVPTPHLNGHHTIFGQVTDGQPVVVQTQQGDLIQGIDILDPTGPLFAAEAKPIAEWNTALDARNAKATPAATPAGK